MASKNTAFLELSTSNYLGNIQTQNHTFHFDEPTDLGGQDLHPSPQNYLLGALASCTAATLRMYSQRKGCELGKINIRVEMQETKQRVGKSYKFIKDISFENKKLEAAQIDRLLKIANKCPVSQILESQAEMQEQVVASFEEGQEKQYANEDITIHWKSNRCIHSKKCWQGLIEVFNPKERPWINPEGADTEVIIKQINKCPSGALSYTQNKEKEGGA